jgi:hypothetical protein
VPSLHATLGLFDPSADPEVQINPLLGHLFLGRLDLPGQLGALRCECYLVPRFCHRYHCKIVIAIRVIGAEGTGEE